MRQDDIVDVDIVEDAPEHPGTVAQVVTDTLRTARGCLMNFRTALENFETRLSAESSEEAAPKDPAMLALGAVANHVLSTVRGPIASMVPGGAVLNSLVTLGTTIDSAISADRARSAQATQRNAAAEFIIRVRTMVNNAAVDVETTMTEDEIAAGRRFEEAASDEERTRIRRHFERLNDQITQLEAGPLSPETIFVRLAEAWINETGGQDGVTARVVINVDHAWQVSRAYLDAPFGSRLAQQLEQQGGLPLSNLAVPRILQWRPIEGDSLPMISCELAPDNTSSNLVVRGVQAGPHVRTFIRHLGGDPVPPATVVTGRAA